MTVSPDRSSRVCVGGNGARLGAAGWWMESSRKARRAHCPSWWPDPNTGPLLALKPGASCGGAGLLCPPPFSLSQEFCSLRARVLGRAASRKEEAAQTECRAAVHKAPGGLPCSQLPAGRAGLLGWPVRAVKAGSEEPSGRKVHIRETVAATQCWGVNGRVLGLSLFLMGSIHDGPSSETQTPR